MITNQEYALTFNKNPFVAGGFSLGGIQRWLTIQEWTIFGKTTGSTASFVGEEMDGECDGVLFFLKPNLLSVLNFISSENITYSNTLSFLIF